MRTLLGKLFGRAKSIESDPIDRWPTVLGSDHTITIGGASLLPGNAVTNALTLHSMNLHASLLMSQTFADATVLLPKLLSEKFDTSVYANPLESARKDFLTHLLNDQIKVGYTSADGLLKRFAADINKLTNYGANLKDGELGKALIGIAIADYYFMQNGFSGKDFFNALTGGLSFDLADIQSPKGWSNNKTVIKLGTAAITQFLNGDYYAGAFLAQANYWSLQSGTDALVATGTGTNNGAMFGGTTDDFLNGDAGDDVLFWNAANDSEYYPFLSRSAA